MSKERILTLAPLEQVLLCGIHSCLSWFVLCYIFPLTLCLFILFKVCLIIVLCTTVSMLAEDFAKVHWAWAPRTSELLSISLYSLQPGEHKCLVASVLQGSPGSAEGNEVAMCSCPVKSQSVGQVIRMSDMVALLSLIRKSNVN